jgi:putative FmdB family regulatory protein
MRIRMLEWAAESLQEKFTVPLYEYECAKCGKRFEKIEKVTAPHRQKCPACGGRAERLLAPPAFQFKGSGWYVTDYASKSAAKSEAKETAETKATGETKEATEKKETKEAKPTEAKPHKESKKR